MYTIMSRYTFLKLNLSSEMFLEQRIIFHSHFCVILCLDSFNKMNISRFPKNHVYSQYTISDVFLKAQ